MIWRFNNDGNKTFCSGGTDQQFYGNVIKTYGVSEAEPYKQMHKKIVARFCERYVNEQGEITDGYASVGVAMIIGGMKITCSAHIPEVAIDNVKVLKNASMALIRFGYGDMLNKYSCLIEY